MTTFNSGNSGYYLNPQYLEELAGQYRNAYRQAKPYPHVVIENFLPAEVLEQVLEELSTTDSLNHITHWLLEQLNSAAFLSFLEQLTGIDSLLADPQVESIGLHALQPGKPFKIQDECARYRKSLDRKLNCLIYLNKDWKEEYGGHLELWNDAMAHCEKRILPTFNRCVIFGTTEFSYYGHPEPLNCPDHETRKLLALYYCVNRTGPEMAESVFLSPTHHVSPKEMVRFEKQPIDAIVKTFIKKLIPVLSRI